MPAAVLAFAPALHAALPGLSVSGRAVLDALLLVGGRLGPAHRVAHSLGLHSRFQLARLLGRDGLPPLHRLADWITVLGWVWEGEQSGTSLFQLALQAGRDPRAARRTVERVLGVSWPRARASGAGWVLVRFLDECRSFRAAALSAVQIA